MIGRSAALLFRRGLRTAGGRQMVEYMPANTAKDMLPFNPFQNEWLLLLKIGIYSGSAFGTPFFMVWWGLKKKYGPKE